MSSLAYDRYVIRLFAVRFLGFLAFFVIILQMLDLLNKSSDIMEVAGAGSEQLLRYISLRAPEIVSQFTPFAALLGIVVTLAGLNHTSELTVMRVAGMSINRILLPIGFGCALIATAHFAYHELAVVNASERLAYWEANDYALDLPESRGARTNVWLTYDDQVIHAQSAVRAPNAVVLTALTIYDISDPYQSENVTLARSGRYEDGAWRLFDVRLMNAESQETQTLGVDDWQTNLDPEYIFALAIDPARTKLGELWRQITQLRTERADARNSMTSFLARFSKPLATLVMPLLGAIAGFGVHRQGALILRSVTGAALGFSYFVAENLLLALGKLGVLPAVFGAFFPLALFMVVGFAIVMAMENS